MSTFLLQHVDIKNINFDSSTKGSVSLLVKGT